MRGVRSQHRAELECGESPRSEGRVVARAKGARWREGCEGHEVKMAPGRDSVSGVRLQLQGCVWSWRPERGKAKGRLATPV